MSASLRSGNSVLGTNPQQILASIWQRNLPVVRKRLSALNAAAAEAAHDQLSVASRKEAADIAHKLAGSLGMFGYPRGTEIAQELELLLETDGPVPGARFIELTSQLTQTLQI